ncbi:MAG: FxLYD domain-containing protein [Deltaproteobacteria bacterium]
MAEKGGRSGTVIVLVFVVAGMLLAYAYFRGRDVTDAKKKVPQQFVQVDAGTAVVKMTEEERRAYIKANVRVESLEIGPNMKPDRDEPVPGLLEVRGSVVNDGDQALDRVFVHVYPKDADGKVIGSHIENVARVGGLLDAGERRDFKFTIPDKKEFGGDFDHMLQ